MIQKRYWARETEILNVVFVYFEQKITQLFGIPIKHVGRSGFKRLLLLFGVILHNRLCLKLDKSEFKLSQLVSKVTLELRIWAVSVDLRVFRITYRHLAASPSF